MLTHTLSPDTQAILLLCASFGQNRASEPQPLTLREYNAVASWLLENSMTPGDLLEPTLKHRLPQLSIGKLNSERLVALLERGVMLSLAVEKWTNQGLWFLGRGDARYPKRLKQKLRHSAPSILYGVGNIELLSQGGLAVVGSRDVDEEGLNYTQHVVQTCAHQGIQVISGGARGVDQISMLGALEAGGNTVGVLAGSLTKVAVSGKYRQSIKEGRLTLVSPYDPDAGFSIGNAMGRNKHIYALVDYALVVSCSVEKGGTWAGAVEALDKIENVPVFVRTQGTVPEGNQQLLEQGAMPFPEDPWNYPLRELRIAATAEVEPTETEREVKHSDAMPDAMPVRYYPKDIYEAVLPFLLQQLEQPQNAKSLAESLDVRPAQMQDWLNQAVAEGKVKKNNKPVTYEVNRNEDLLSLLESFQ
jgi:predicted Rossmann fold nucleotide-binding protein DprA/Smf involved in DNA uptake